MLRYDYIYKIYIRMCVCVLINTTDKCYWPSLTPSIDNTLEKELSIDFIGWESRLDAINLLRKGVYMDYIYIDVPWISEKNNKIRTEIEYVHTWV